MQCFIISYAENAGIELSAKSAVLMEASTGTVLYESDKDARLPIASVTKIMTMLLTMEAIDSGKISIDETVTASERAKSMGGSTMFLETGEQLPVSDILKGIAVASANDGAVAIAEHISGSVESFVELMNSRAQELGMKNTHFVNTNGLDDNEHYSSALDVAIMSRELIKHEKIFEYTTIWMDTLRDGKFQLANTNKLIRFYKGANGLKTGSTSIAKCCLSATAKRDDMQLIAVVLGAPTSKERFADATKLLDYGFANYSVQQYAAKNEAICETQVSKGVIDNVTAVAAEDVTMLGKKGTPLELKREMIIESVSAPIEKGQEIGTLELKNETGETVASVPLVSDRDVQKKGIVGCIHDVIGMWLHG
jgi:D-alanyl-D-alanine carboxypeptidase (penicillin-binding protein 5/6)